MKTNEPSFQNYLVKDGQAVPEIENPYHKLYQVVWGEGKWKTNPDWEAFETWKQSHTYATNAPDGCWPVERFDIVWQISYNGGAWHNVKKSTYEKFKNYDDFNADFNKNGIGTRQFAKFKEEVEKPKERKIHYLKTWQPYFDNVKEDKKKFEVRKNDRDYQVGDLVILKEYDHVNKTYTDRSIQKEIIYILQGGSFGIEPGYCVLQLL